MENSINNELYNKLINTARIIDERKALNENFKRIISSVLGDGLENTNSLEEAVKKFIHSTPPNHDLDQLSRCLKNIGNICYIPKSQQSFTAFPGFIKRNEFKALPKSDKTKKITSIIKHMSAEQKDTVYNLLHSIHFPSNLENDGRHLTYNEFQLLTPFSKKKVAITQFTAQYLHHNPDALLLSAQALKTKINTQINEIITNLIDRIDFFDGQLEVLQDCGMDDTILMVIDAFLGGNQVAYFRNNLGVYIDDEASNVFQELLTYFPNKTNLKYSQLLFGEGIDGDTTQDITIKEKSVLGMTISPESKKYELPYNPLSSDVKLSAGIDYFGKDKFEDIFNGFYKKVLDELIKKIDGAPLHEVTFESADHKQLNPNGQRGKKLHSMIATWDTSIGAYAIDRHFLEICAIVKKSIKDLQINTLGYSAYPGNGFKKPLEKRNQFRGSFRTNTVFDGANITHFRQTENKNKSMLQLSVLDELTIKEDIYLILQLSYFLKHGSIIKEHELHYLLHETMIKHHFTEKVYPIDGFEEQYELLYKNVIWPLSKEAKEQGIQQKAKHTVLIGPPGTGKTQFINSLLTKKEFSFNSKNVTLNACVIPLTVDEIQHLVTKNKTFLTNIVDDLQMPIILTIEDIDRGIQASKAFEQQLTIFLNRTNELGITVVSSSNHRGILTQRLIRDDRLNNIIPFTLPLDQKLAESIICNTCKTYKLPEIYHDKLLNYLPKMEYFSTSYITGFVKSVSNEIEFRKSHQKSDTLNDQDIEKIFNELTVPVQAMQENNKDLLRWVQSIKDKNGRDMIGYK